MNKTRISNKKIGHGCAGPQQLNPLGHDMSCPYEFLNSWANRDLPLQAILAG